MADENEVLEDLLSDDDFSEAITASKSVVADLESAETVETLGDFHANILSALNGAKALARRLEAFERRVKAKLTPQGVRKP